MKLLSTLTRRPAVLVTGTVLSALVLAGCGTTGDPSPNSQGRSPAATLTADAFNAQDVSFATDMLSHHRQAVEMADMALGRTTTPAVKDLATRIRSAQSPEIVKLTGFLTAFGAPVPAAGGDMMGHTTGGHLATGMMTGSQMSGLDAAMGSGFAKQFLTLMGEHHRGAVQMSQTELARGKHGPARELATAVITAQNAEITEMDKLLATS